MWTIQSAIATAAPSGSTACAAIAASMSASSGGPVDRLRPRLRAATRRSRTRLACSARRPSPGQCRIHQPRRRLEPAPLERLHRLIAQERPAQGSQAGDAARERLKRGLLVGRSDEVVSAATPDSTSSASIGSVLAPSGGTGRAAGESNCAAGVFVSQRSVSHSAGGVASPFRAVSCLSETTMAMSIFSPGRFTSTSRWRIGRRCCARQLVLGLAGLRR